MNSAPLLKCISAAARQCIGFKQQREKSISNFKTHTNFIKLCDYQEIKFVGQKQLSLMMYNKRFQHKSHFT